MSSAFRPTQRPAPPPPAGRSGVLPPEPAPPPPVGPTSTTTTTTTTTKILTATVGPPRGGGGGTNRPLPSPHARGGGGGATSPSSPSSTTLGGGGSPSRLTTTSPLPTTRGGSPSTRGGGGVGGLGSSPSSPSHNTANTNSTGTTRGGSGNVRGSPNHRGSPPPGHAPPVAPRKTTTISQVFIDPADLQVQGGTHKSVFLIDGGSRGSPSKLSNSSSSSSSSSGSSLSSSSSSSSSSASSSSSLSLSSPSSSSSPSSTSNDRISIRIPDAGEPSQPMANPNQIAAPEIPIDESLYKTRRDKIAKEILTTEITYVTSLAILVETFFQPLEKNGMVSEAELKILGLHGIRSIYGVNKVFLEALIKTIGQKWSPTECLGEVFKQFTPWLKMYREYTEAYEAALNKLIELNNKNQTFANFVKTWEEQPKAFMLPIASFLIMPVQRIPRYNLLLRDLVKETDPSHPDSQGLQKSLTEMETVAAYINESIKIAESRRKLISVQNSLVGSMNLIEPHRRFIRDGVLIKVCRRTDKERAFFLFNDGLIYADPLPTPSGTSPKFRFRRFIPIGNLKIYSLPDNDDETPASPSPTMGYSAGGSKKARKNAFMVLNDMKSFVVYAQTAEERNSWMMSIYDVQVAQPNQTMTTDDESFSPIWMPDSETTRCLGCGSAFGLFTRRHHCRKCGLIFCSSCTGKRVVLSKARKDPERVCNRCFETITGESSIDDVYIVPSSSPNPEDK